MDSLKKSAGLCIAFALLLIFSPQSLAMNEVKDDGLTTSPHRLDNKSIPIIFGPGLGDWLSTSYPKGEGSPKLTTTITMIPMGKESSPDPKSWIGHHPLTFQQGTPPGGCNIDLTKFEGEGNLSLPVTQCIITFACRIAGDGGKREWTFKPFSPRNEHLTKPLVSMILERARCIWLGEEDSSMQIGDMDRGDMELLRLRLYNGNAVTKDVALPSSPTKSRPASSSPGVIAFLYSWTPPVRSILQSVGQWIWPPKNSESSPSATPPVR